MVAVAINMEAPYPSSKSVCKYQESLASLSLCRHFLCVAFDHLRISSPKSAGSPHPLGVCELDSAHHAEQLKRKNSHPSCLNLRMWRLCIWKFRSIQASLVGYWPVCSSWPKAPVLCQSGQWLGQPLQMPACLLRKQENIFMQNHAAPMDAMC